MFSVSVTEIGGPITVANCRVRLLLHFEKRNLVVISQLEKSPSIFLTNAHASTDVCPECRQSVPLYPKPLPLEGGQCSRTDDHFESTLAGRVLQEETGGSVHQSSQRCVHQLDHLPAAHHQ
uniref:Uncharacterized protein n=1 Tax=Timema cristinae TaxID=61476 RepID=A0A7R9CWX9_TIMCR|nr:unnamed protein product [Timema cristinae]